VKNNINNIYILGLGALGSLYGANLYDLNPQSVKIIANKKRITALEQSGISVNGKKYAFNYIEPGDASHPPADLVIISVKYLQLHQAINDVMQFIGADTIVISLLNGISSEDLIGAGIGMEHLLYAYGVGMDAVRQGNEVTYKNMGKLVFGEKHNEALSDRVKAVKNLFEKAKIPFQIPVDMEKALWSKFMMNTGINQASAVLKAPYGSFQQDGEARDLMLAASNEVLLLAQHADINLDQSDVDSFLKIISTLDPSGKTSMLQDIEAGRKSEVDLFAGTVVELGKKYKVPTPVNAGLLSRIREMEGLM
jgi:2-dehydropantoate 2-reductase